MQGNLDLVDSRVCQVRQVESLAQFHSCNFSYLFTDSDKGSVQELVPSTVVQKFSSSKMTAIVHPGDGHVESTVGNRVEGRRAPEEGSAAALGDNPTAHCPTGDHHPAGCPGLKQSPDRRPRAERAHLSTEGAETVRALSPLPPPPSLPVAPRARLRALADLERAGRPPGFSPPGPARGGRPRRSPSRRPGL
jgi:hypothetical protein